MRIYGYQFAAGETHVIHARGQYVRGISAPLRYQIQIEDGPATDFETGIAYEPPEPFTFIRITNSSDEPQFIELAIANGTVADNRLVGGAMAIKPGQGLQSVGDIAGGGAIPSNKDRTRLVMRAAPGNAGSLTIAGIPLEPGDIWELALTGGAAVSGATTDILHVAEVI